VYVGYDFRVSDMGDNTDNFSKEKRIDVQKKDPPTYDDANSLLVSGGSRHNANLQCA